MSFEQLHLIAPIADALKKKGYTIPTPIQSQSIPVILLANKCDLDVTEDNDKKYCGKTEEEMNEFCKMYGFVSWLPVSAKNNVGLDEAMNVLIKELLDKSLTNVDDTEIITIVNERQDPVVAMARPEAPVRAAPGTL